ncbi:hypothetical protein MA16_Dca009756 [Dendrobium catenatum]|uniref:Uncharacterized protein n=1 Tax=Dendrobium catenatum TaxID=906689 RepID=A0A2I0VZ54_9ASPA|nr:hypothetical protein MA16_Dca009756 [Dendrobium catenatum]
MFIEKPFSLTIGEECTFTKYLSSMTLSFNLLTLAESLSPPFTSLVWRTRRVLLSHPYSGVSMSSFHLLSRADSSTRLHPSDEEPRGAGEEEAPAPAPIPDPVPLHQHSPVDQLIERFDRWETRFDAYVATQEQQHSENIAHYDQHRTEDLAHFDSYITHQQQQHEQDIVWFNS